MTLKLPQIIGHRGCAGYAPENTLESIHTAADMGIECVELDVKLTKDYVPIIFHDDTLERTTNGFGLVAETLYKDLKHLEAGSWFANSFSGLKIPTLEEVLDVLIDRDIGLNLELKPCPGREIETTEVALDLLSQYWDDHDKLLLTSYSKVSLEACIELAPEWGRGIVLGHNCEENWLKALKEDKLPEQWHEVIEYLKLSVASIDEDFCSAGLIRSIQDTNILPIPYNVNTAERAHELQILGVKTVISDEPDEIKEGLLTVH